MPWDEKKDFQYIFGQSYTRVIESERLFDTFYDTFIASSPQVAEKFRGTDLERQKRMLEQSLGYVTGFHTDLMIEQELVDVARMHDKHHRDIGPEFYDKWVDCLIEAVKACDPQFTREVELAWRLTLAPGITYMKFQYDREG